MSRAGRRGLTLIGCYMTLLYKRSLNLVITPDNTSRIILSEPKIEFEIKRDSDPNPPTGTLTIWNLKQETENQIKQKDGAVVLSGGYAGQVGTLINGTLRRVERERTGLARLTRLQVGGETTRSDMLGGITDKSYQGIVEVSKVVRDAIADMGLIMGSLALIPASAQVENYAFSGKATDFLTQILERVGLHWFDDNGVVRLNRIGESIGGEGVVRVITPRTGLIGTPSITDEGARARMLLSPQIGIGDRVRIESVALENSEWKVASLLHKGDNWDGDFFTDLELRPLA